MKNRSNHTFNVEADNGENFDEDYSTPINKPKKIKLDETELF